jgi:CHAT domain-containing protein
MSAAALLAWVDSRRPRPARKTEPWACLVRRSGPPIWVELHGSGPGGSWTDADDALPGLVREALFGKPRGAAPPWQILAARLVAQRLAPLADHLGGGADLPAVRHLIVLPGSSMAGVPVEALTNRHSISYAPSGTMFAWLRQQEREAARRRNPATAPQLLVLGDPVFQPLKRGQAEGTRAAAESPDPLPGTRWEATEIAALFPRSKMLLGSEASEQRLEELAAAGQLREYRFLHLATHAALDDRRPLQSALLLARDRLPDPVEQVLRGQRIYDGRLTAEQILGSWSLDAELVTLSACQTGLGPHSGSEGYLGFSQALFLSGARSLVLSLWEVDDRATALLMERFYHNLLGKRPGLDHPLPKAAALQEARDWLRHLPPR